MRALGAILLAVLPMYCGFALAEEQRRTTRDLFGVLELLSHIRYEISAFLTRRSDLFLRFECPSLEKSGFLSALKCAAGTTDNALYHLLTQTDTAMLSLLPEDLRLLTEYAKTLGEFDAAEEIERLDRVRALLSESYETQKKEQQNRVRLYRAFGVVTGLAVLLFVW